MFFQRLFFPCSQADKHCLPPTTILVDTKATFEESPSSQDPQLPTTPRQEIATPPSPSQSSPLASPLALIPTPQLQAPANPVPSPLLTCRDVSPILDTSRPVSEPPSPIQPTASLLEEEPPQDTDIEIFTPNEPETTSDDKDFFETPKELPTPKVENDKVASPILTVDSPPQTREDSKPEENEMLPKLLFDLETEREPRASAINLSGMSDPVTEETTAVLVTPPKKQETTLSSTPSTTCLSEASITPPSSQQKWTQATAVLQDHPNLITTSLLNSILTQRLVVTNPPHSQDPLTYASE